MTPRAQGPLAGRRVAVVNWRDLGHHLAGGSEIYAWEYARALRDAGARVDFVTARDQGQRRSERLEGIEVLRRGGVFTFYLAAAWYLLTRRRHLDAVVDPECGIPTFSPLFVRRGTRVVLVVHHVHQDQFATYFSAPLAKLGQLLERRVMPVVYRRATTVAVSESTRDEMVRRLGWTRPVEILQNGSLDPDRTVTAAGKDPQRLVVLGRLVPHKRVDLVIRSVARLRAEFPALHLDIVGRGPEEQRLRGLVDELGVADAVTLHGFLSDPEKARVLRDAALHVCASDAEGWGQVVIEAAAFGTPTVARDVPGMRDSIQPGLTGWLVPDSPGRLDQVGESLTACLRSALHELATPAGRQEPVRRCQQWAARFSWQTMHRRGVGLVAGAPPGQRMPVRAQAQDHNRSRVA